MKVLFLQNIKNVAQIGDIKDVSDGYARNYLFPRSLAQLATPGMAKKAEELKQRNAQLLAATKQEAEKLATALKDLVVELTEEANEEGHLYGSVAAERLVEELKKHNFGIKEEAIQLEHPLKSVGEHIVDIELQPEVTTQIKVIITAK